MREGRECHGVGLFGEKRQVISDSEISPKHCPSLPELSPISLRGMEQKENIRPLGGKDG